MHVKREDTPALSAEEKQQEKDVEGREDASFGIGDSKVLHQAASNEDNLLRNMAAAKREDWAILLVHINVVFYALFFWLSQPVLPYLSKDLGADPILFGYLQTLFSFGQLVGGPLMGRVIDARGPKIGILVAHGSAGLSYLLLAFSYSLPVLFLSRIPTLLMHAMQAAQSAITDLSDEKSRAQSLGRVSLSYGIGFLVGPYLGGLLSKYLGYYAVAHIGALGSLLMMLATLSLLPNTREMLLKREAKDKLKGVQLRKEDKERERKGKEEENKEREKEKQKRGEMNFADILRVVERKPIRNVLILKVLAGLGFAVFHSSFSMVAQDTFKLSPEETGFMLSYSGALSIAVNTFFVGWATKLYPDGVIVKWALLLLCVSFFILSFVSSFYQLLLLMIPLSLAGTTMYTVVTSILTKLVEKGETGTVIGLDHATRSLSSVVAPTIGGYLFSYFGYSSLGIFSATVVGVSFVFWELLHHLY